MGISAKNPHLKFKKNWSLTQDIVFHLGQCDSLIRAISSLPLQPNHKEQLLSVSLIKGAIATTAIEGNTLTEEDRKYSKRQTSASEQGISRNRSEKHNRCI